MNIVNAENKVAEVEKKTYGEEVLSLRQRIKY